MLLTKQVLPTPEEPTRMTLHRGGRYLDIGTVDMHVENGRENSLRHKLFNYSVHRLEIELGSRKHITAPIGVMYTREVIVQ